MHPIAPIGAPLTQKNISYTRIKLIEYCTRSSNAILRGLQITDILVGRSSKHV